MHKSTIVLALLVGIAWAGSPPLSHLPETILQDKDEFLSQPTHFAFNFGLNGAVTQEDWDRATIKDVAPPVVVHPNLNGNPRPVTITGKMMTSIKERELYAFLGIRYGKPPIDNLRFKKTEPADPYFGPDDTLDATYMGEKCPQTAMLGDGAAGSEDCLSLNVFMPYLPDDLPGGNPLPVMMFIHGGAFVSGDSSLYLPTRLLDHDVILVVIHYRLGSLGFFSLQNEDAPGNAALWDQIEAMKWIRDNIGGFGGDPDRVTIFGESAGSVSVNYHLFLPESKGLFHGVIGESGSALEHWALDPEPIFSAKFIATKNGCDNSSETTMYDCMKNLPHETLSLNMHDFVNEDRQRGEMGFRGAAPVMDSSDVSRRLVTKYPKQYYEDGDASDVPLMIGCNKHEGSFVLGIMYTAYLLPNHYVDDSYYLKNYILSDLLNAFGVRDMTNGIGESLEDAYLTGVDMTDFPEAAPGLMDTAGVFFLKAGGWMTAKLHAKHTTSETYFYSFDFESDDTMFHWLFIGYNDIPFRPGVTHADELMYLFSFPALLEGQQLVVKDRMVKMWTNFAIYGNPTPDSDKSWQDLNIPKWQSVTDDEHPYMLIQDECTLEDEYPARWHIALNEAQGEVTTEAPTPTMSPTPTMGPSQAAYNQMEQERQAFMISMIVFVVATVGLGAACIFLFLKVKGTMA